MGAKSDRKQAVTDHQKFLSDNTKTEQKRYEEAKAQADASSRELAEIIVKIGEAKSELSCLNRKIIGQNKEILCLLDEAKDLNDKKDLLLKQLDELERSIEDKKENFDKYCADRKAELMIKETSLKELEDDLDTKAKETSLAHTSAKKDIAQLAQDRKDTEAKIAELKELASNHARNIAKYDQDRAKLKDEQEVVDKDRETLKQALIRLNTREKSLNDKESTLNAKDEELKDKETCLDLKEVTLARRENRINDLISIHNLTGKV